MTANICIQISNRAKETDVKVTAVWSLDIIYSVKKMDLITFMYNFVTLMEENWVQKYCIDVLWLMVEEDLPLMRHCKDASTFSNSLFVSDRVTRSNSFSLHQLGYCWPTAPFWMSFWVRYKQQQVF